MPWVLLPEPHKVIPISVSRLYVDTKYAWASYMQRLRQDIPLKEAGDVSLKLC